MQTSWACTCGKTLRANAEYAGRRVKCPQCQSPQVIPAATPPPLTRDVETVSGSTAWASKKPSLAQIAARSLAKDRDAYSPPPRTFQDYMYLVLLLALMPLLLITFHKDDFSERLERSIADEPQLQLFIAEVKEQLKIDGPIWAGLLARFPDRFFAELHGDRLESAMLRRDSFAHFGLAAISAAVFFLLLMTIFPRDSTKLLHIPLITLLTGTIGILLLLGIQALANATRGVFVVGILGIPLLILKFIGASYGAADDPNANVLVSAFGFMCSVGMLEEMVKALPLFWVFRQRMDFGWRAACLWGLASGVGFGIVEGIMYSGTYYNGIEPAGTYLVRFASCVALHAVWTASAALICFKLQSELREAEGLTGLFSAALGAVVISMILHGLYDTALKKDAKTVALIFALISFAFLAWQIERQRRKDALAMPIRR